MWDRFLCRNKLFPFKLQRCDLRVICVGTKCHLVKRKGGLGPPRRPSTVKRASLRPRLHKVAALIFPYGLLYNSNMAAVQTKREVFQITHSVQSEPVVL